MSRSKPFKQRIDHGNIFYVYILFSIYGIPFYVGKGKGDRWLTYDKKFEPDNRYKNDIIEHCLNFLGEVPKIKIQENVSEKEAFKTEIALIKAIGRFPKGPLTNLTDGGDGVSGQIRSAYSRKRMSEARKGKPGHLHTAEHKNKIKGKGNPNYGNRWSLEQKQSLSAKKKGKPGLKGMANGMYKKTGALNPNYGAKAFTAETRRRLSIAMVRRQKENPKIGLDHPSSILTAEQVIEIRTSYRWGVITYRDLADRFGVHWMTVGRIIRKETYKDV